MLVDAVGGEHEHVATLQFQRLVVDLELRIEAHAPAQVAFPLRHPGAVVLRELLERVSLQPVNPRVADVEKMRGGAFQDQAAQCADVAAILVVAERAVEGARMQPGVGRRKHAVC